VGTALPVVVFAVLIAQGTQYLSRSYQVLSKVELWARRLTGVAFIAIGVFYCLRYVYGVV
jgi:cytochrome c-type biogenesis protein